MPRSSKPKNKITRPKFSVLGIICEVSLTKRQKRKVERMYEPFSPSAVKWDEFERALQSFEATNVESHFYESITYVAADEATGRSIADQITKLIG